MTTLPPIGALLICWLIGFVFGSPGIGFMIGISAMIATAAIQHRWRSLGS